MSSHESSEPTDFERVGAERLRQIVDDFVSQMTSDPMIGFFFHDVDTERLARMEFQFTARALGAKIRYEGRPIRQAHASRRIMGGQFARRATLLKEAFEAHGVSADVVARLMTHVEALRPLVTAQGGSHCEHQDSGGGLVTAWSADTGQVNVEESWD